MSETQAIWAALAAVQTELKTQAHTRRVDVGKYGYTYTELSALCDYLLPVLGAAGIATTYTTRLAAESSLEIECRLTAGDGSHVEASVFIAPEAWDAQSVGKACTYGRRYSLQFATGIATEADDDCAPKDAKHAPKTAAAPKPAAPKPATAAAGQSEREQLEGTGISDAQRRAIFGRVKEIFGGAAPDDEVRANCTAVAMRLHGKSVSQLTKTQASGVIDWLKDATVAKLNDDIPM